MRARNKVRAKNLREGGKKCGKPEKSKKAKEKCEEQTKRAGEFYYVDS